MYKIISEDNNTGTIKVQIDPITIVLPIDEFGNVPVGSDLDLLINKYIPSYNGNMHPKSADIVISNWNEIKRIVEDHVELYVGDLLAKTERQLKLSFVDKNVDVF